MCVCCPQRPKDNVKSLKQRVVSHFCQCWELNPVLLQEHKESQPVGSLALFLLFYTQLFDLIFGCLHSVNYRQVLLRSFLSMTDKGAPARYFTIEAFDQLAIFKHQSACLELRLCMALKIISHNLMNQMDIDYECFPILKGDIELQTEFLLSRMT